jgi:hypothetical protein
MIMDHTCCCHFRGTTLQKPLALTRWAPMITMTPSDGPLIIGRTSCPL